MFITKKKTFLAICNLLKTKFLKKRIPLVVGWSLTNRCNWDCSYCGRKNVNSKELTTEQIFSIIDELSTLKTYCINFTGGEPLLRADISKIINHAKDKGIRIELTSNGALIPQKINEIKNIDTLILSYDGPLEMQGKQRYNGSGEAIVDAIKTLKNNNMPIRLHSVLTKYNLSYVGSILDFAERFNLIVNFTPLRFVPYSKQEDIKLLFPPMELYNLVFGELILKKIKGNKHIGNSFSSLKYFSNFPNEHTKKIGCCAGRIYCRIEANGDIYPCGDLVLKTQPLNCVTNGFSKAFFTMDLRPTEHCNSCWCDNRLELSYIYSLNFEAISNAIKRYRF